MSLCDGWESPCLYFEAPGYTDSWTFCLRSLYIGKCYWGSKRFCLCGFYLLIFAVLQSKTKKIWNTSINPLERLSLHVISSDIFMKNSEKSGLVLHFCKCLLNVWLDWRGLGSCTCFCKQSVCHRASRKPPCMFLREWGERKQSAFECYQMFLDLADTPLQDLRVPPSLKTAAYVLKYHVIWSHRLCPPESSGEPLKTNCWAHPRVSDYLLCVGLNEKCVSPPFLLRATVLESFENVCVTLNILPTVTF